MYKKYWLLVSENRKGWYYMYDEYYFFISALLVGFVLSFKYKDVEIRSEKWHWTIRG